MDIFLKINQAPPYIYLEYFKPLIFPSKQNRIPIIAPLTGYPHLSQHTFYMIYLTNLVIIGSKIIGIAS